MTKDLNAKTMKGVSWNLLRVAIQAIFSLIVMAVLARLLPPENFGQLALALVFIGFAELLSSLGMGPAVIQKKHITNDQIISAQTFSMYVGLGLTIITILIAKSISNFYDDKQIEILLTVLSLSLFISALGAVARSMIMRKLAFRKLFFIDLIAYTIGYPLIAITLAINDYGVWSLVWGHMALSTIDTVLSLLSEKISFTFILKPKDLSKLLNFGVGASLSSTVNYIAANIDYLIIGRVLGAGPLGFYSKAYHLITLPLIKISATISSVLFSSMSAVQGNNRKIRKAYFHALEAITLITFPILFVFFVSSELVIYGIYGEQWYDAIEVFRILAIAGLFKSVFNLSGTIIQATGNVYAELKRQVIYFIILLLGCLSFVKYGTVAVAWVGVIASIFLYLSKAQLALKIIDSHWRNYFKAQVPAVLLSLFIGVIVSIYIFINDHFLHFSNWLAFLILIMISGISFILGLYILPNRLMGYSTMWARRKIGRIVLTKMPFTDSSRIIK